MSVSEDLIQPTSDSFWEVDGYKSTVKRREDGLRMCSELMSLIQDRAEIEKHYSKDLKAWSKKWHDLIDKGPDYGTTKAAWKGVLTESEGIAEIHVDIKDKLINNVQATVKQWKTDNFHKPVMGPCKETKHLEDEFKKAQKPWAKRLGKVMKAKKEYHNACKLEKTATVQENNARADSGISADQMRKLQDKSEKCKKDVMATQDRYEHTINDLNGYNAKYMEDMTEVFAKAQEFEEKRLQFFKEMLFGIHSSLDISGHIELPQIYQMLNHTIDQADYQKDLKWWSQNHGVDMGMNWPTLEEYSQDFHSISRKEKKGAGHHNEGVTLTNIQKNEPVVQDPFSVNNRNSTVVQSSAPPASAPPPLQSNGGQAQFDGDDWDEYDNPLVDDGAEGTPVRALYDYDGQEGDELSFKVGDVFVKLKDKDDQGWCTGRKSGNVGLYPDNYVETV